MAVRFGLTAADQCLSSVSNFLVGVAVARFAGLAAFGGYALAYAVWLLIAALHRSLVTDVMAIENDLRKPDAAAHIRVGLAAELALGLGAAVGFAACGAVLLASGHRSFGLSFVGLAPWLPCLLAQDYWRWVAFLRSRPAKALANDLVFDLLQAAAFVVLLIIGIDSSLVAVGAWGIGATGGALLGLWQFTTRPTLRGGLKRARSRWSLSRWLVGQNVVDQASGQSTTLLTAAFLGPTALGGLKAAYNLVIGPSMVFIQASGSIGLPEASRALAERGWPGLRRVSRVLTASGSAVVALVALVILLFGHRLLALVYGDAFAKFAGVADVLAIGMLISTVHLGAMVCLKATRNTRSVFWMSALTLVVSIISMVILAPLFGIMGAAVSSTLDGVVYSLGILITHWILSRRSAEQLSGEQLTTAAPSPTPRLIEAFSARQRRWALFGAVPIALVALRSLRGRALAAAHTAFGSRAQWGMDLPVPAKGAVAAASVAVVATAVTLGTGLVSLPGRQTPAPLPPQVSAGRPFVSPPDSGTPDHAVPPAGASGGHPAGTAGSNPSATTGGHPGATSGSNASATSGGHPGTTSGSSAGGASGGHGGGSGATRAASIPVMPPLSVTPRSTTGKQPQNKAATGSATTSATPAGPAGTPAVGTTRPTTIPSSTSTASSPASSTSARATTTPTTRPPATTAPTRPATTSAPPTTARRATTTSKPPATTTPTTKPPATTTTP